MARRAIVAAGIVLLAQCTAQPQSSEEQSAQTIPDLVDTTGANELSVAVGKPGDPLPGLASQELDLFAQGKSHFMDEEGVADGLGPVFNETSCVACHLGGDASVGGSNGRLETRFGRHNADGSFDPLAAEGGSLLQDHGIGRQAARDSTSPASYFDFVAETVPAEANVIARRRTTPLFGLGLVDAVPDAEFRALAATQRFHAPSVAGKVAVVTDLATGKPAVGKFGWKNANPTLLQFSADAYLNEMGITTPLFPNENCPQADCSMMAQYNARPDLNDADGADVLAFTNFMMFLAPPPRGQRTLVEKRGELAFASIGCAVCHVPTLVTGPNAVQALHRKVFHPYSDFLLHDMGSLGDGIAQGAAGPREMRTAPLWGLAANATLLHDGRATTAADAILAHDGQGRRARDRFARLDHSVRAALLAFLASL